MGHENFEPNLEAPVGQEPAEEGLENGSDIVEGKEIESEDEVSPETPDIPQETELETLDLLKGVPEAPLEPEDEL